MKQLSWAVCFVVCVVMIALHALVTQTIPALLHNRLAYCNLPDNYSDLCAATIA